MKSSKLDEQPFSLRITNRGAKDLNFNQLYFLELTN